VSGPGRLRSGSPSPPWLSGLGVCGVAVIVISFSVYNYILCRGAFGFGVFASVPARGGKGLPEVLVNPAPVRAGGGDANSVREYPSRLDMSPLVRSVRGLAGQIIVVG